jgi:hypothetical protein
MMRFRTRSDAARYSAQSRWRAAEARAQAEREDGIPDRHPAAEWRSTCIIDLRGAGGPLLTLEPRAGYVSWRAVDQAGNVIDCAALKTLLHTVADALPRELAARRLS